MVKTSYLKAQMEEQNKNLAQVAQAIGISRKTLSKKLKGESEFKLFEAQIISRELKIKNPTSVFFD